VAIPKRGIVRFVDLRDEIESFSDMVKLQEQFRLFEAVRLVVVHHSGSDLEGQTPMSIARYRVLEIGDATVPYHFMIPRSGALYMTARLCYWLPNCGKPVANAESVSICCPGDYRAGKWQPTGAQLDTLRRLIWRVLPEFLGGGWGEYRGLYVIPHSRVTGTECPGENLVNELIWRGRWPDLPFFR